MPTTVPPPPPGFRLVTAEDADQQQPPKTKTPKPPPGFTLIGDNQAPAPAPIPGMERLGGGAPPAAPAWSPAAVEPVRSASSLVGDIAGGLVRGTSNTLLSVPQALSRLPGGLNDQLAALGPKGTTPQDVSGLTRRAVEESLPPAPATGIGQFSEMFASTVPYIASAVIPGGPAVLGVLGGTEEALSRADDSGKKLSPKQRAAIGAAGSLIGSTEALPIGRLFGHLKKAGVVSKAVDEEKLIRELFPKWTDYLKSAAKQAAEEGGQEGFTGVAQDAVEAAYDGRQVNQIGESLFTDVAGGGGVGAVLDIAMKLVGSRGGRRHLREAGIDPNKLRQWYEAEAATGAQQEPKPTEDGAAAPKPADAAAAPSPYADAAIAFIGKSDKPVSRNDLVDALEIGPREAGTLLDALVAAGKLKETHLGKQKAYAPAPAPATGQLGLTPAAEATPTDSGGAGLATLDKAVKKSDQGALDLEAASAEAPSVDQIKDDAAKIDTGGARLGTLAAANAVRDRKLAELQERAAEQEAASRTGLASIGAAGKAISDNLHSMLWDKVQRGDTTEAGAPSAVLQAAQVARQRGGLKSPEQLRAFVNDYAGINAGESRQQELQALVDKYSAAAEEPERPAQVEPAYGREVKIAIPGEKTSYAARYAIRELEDAQPSHNPMSFEPNPAYGHQNDRDYRDPQNAARVLEYSTTERFDPEYLVTENPTAEHGPTVIDQEGNALGGNNRLMTLNRVYQLSPAASDRYRSALKARAEQFGIDPVELDRFKRPVLVRERTTPVSAAQKEITDYNKKASANLRPGEQAVTDGNRLSPRSVDRIIGKLEDAGEDGTLADALRGEAGAELIESLVADGVITDQEKAGMLDERDMLTSEAKSRVAKALVGRLFSSPAQFNRTPPETRNKLERIAPQVLRVEGRQDWALTGYVREALDALEILRAHGAKKIGIPTKGDTLDRFIKPFVRKGWIQGLDGLVHTEGNKRGELTEAGKEKVTRLAYRMQEESLLSGQGVVEGDSKQPRQFSPQALAIARTLRLPDRAAAAAFRRYANDESYSRPGAQEVMFEPPKREEAFSDAFEGEGEARLMRPFPDRAMRSDASPSELLQEAKLVYKQGKNGRPGVLYANAQAVQVLTGLGELADRDIQGVFASRRRAESVRANLLRAIPGVGIRNIPALMRLRGEFSKAATDPRGVTVIDAGPGRTLAEVKSTRRHESHHAYEADLPLADANEFLSNPLASVARHHLLEIGYSEDPVELASEIAAHLVEGPSGWGRMGLTSLEQAAELWRAYLQVHPGVYENPHVYPRLKEEGRNDSSPNDTVQGPASPRKLQSPDGSGGQGGGRGLRRGVPEAFQRRSRTDSGADERIRKASADVEEMGQARASRRQQPRDNRTASLFDLFGPESGPSAQEVAATAPPPATTRRTPTAASQPSLFTPEEADATREAAKRDREQLQKDEAEATFASPLVPKARRGKPLQGGLFDTQSNSQAALFDPQQQQPPPEPKKPEETLNFEKDGRSVKVSKGERGWMTVARVRDGNITVPAVVHPSREAAITAAKKFIGEEAEADQAGEPQTDYQSTQANLSGPIAKAVLAAGERIPDADLAEKGREGQPHVTALYGLHGEVDANAVRKALEGEGPISLTLGRGRIFETDDGDVLYAEVESEDLKRINRKLAEALPHTNTHGTYKPHVTIAYLKKGKGEKYVNKPLPAISGKVITLDSIAFSDQSEQQVEIPLTGPASRVATWTPPTERTTPPAKPETGSAADERRVLAAFEEMSAGDPERPYGMKRLRDALPGMDKGQFDMAVLALADAGKVQIHHHDNGASAGLNDAQRAELVHDPLRSGHDAYYGAISRRKPSEEEAGDAIAEINAAILPGMLKEQEDKGEWGYTPEMTQRLSKRDAERLAHVLTAIRTEAGKDTGAIANGLPDAAYPEFMLEDLERPFTNEMWRFTSGQVQHLVKLGMVHWIETDEITGQGGWHPGPAPAKADPAPQPTSQPTPQPRPTMQPTDPGRMALTGDTFRHKHQIRTLEGATWDGTTKRWIVDDTQANRERVRRMSKRIVIETLGQPRPPTPDADTPSSQPRQDSDTGEKATTPAPEPELLYADFTPGMIVVGQDGKRYLAANAVGGGGWGSNHYLMGRPVDSPTSPPITIAKSDSPDRWYGVSKEDTQATPTPAAAPTPATTTPTPAPPSPPPADAAERLIKRIREAIDNGEDIRLKLERLAEEIYGGTRADGDFDKRRIYELQEAAVNGWLADHPEFLTMPLDDAAARIREVLGRLATQTVRNDEQIRKQQFSTPPHIALLVDRLAHVGPTDIVLEPSAGTGGLVALLRDVAKKVHLNEIDAERAALAEQVGFDKPTQHDGEIINALLDRSIQPSVVIMNPPFSAKGTATVDTQNRNKYGWNHLESALQRLAAGGRLVAIMGGGMDGRNEGVRLTATQAAPIWERLAKTYHLRANVGIDGKEYAKYGTTFNVRLIVIDKTGPTPGANWQEQLAGIPSGDFSRVEEVGRSLGVLERAQGPGAADGGNTGSTGQDVPGDRGGRPGTGVLPGPGGGTGNGAAAGGGGGRGSRPANPGSNAPVQSDNDPQLAPQSDPGPEHPAAGPHGDVQGVPRDGDPAVEIRTRAKQTSEDDAGAFVKYHPTVEGNAHPADIVESKSMSTVALPPFTYEPKLPASTPISAVQMESVLIAGQQNERRNPDGTRGAALIGDGTGVGKGRTVAAVLLDNWNHGRRRLIWVSENWRLVEDALRDMGGIKADALASKIMRLDKLHKKGPIAHEGVIFTTYDLLRSEDKKGNTTLKLVEDWLRGNDEAEGSFVAFDEAHEMKNTVTGVGGKVSQIGTKTAELRAALPNLRTVFLSATAATDVINMGYLERLGLWGPNTPFPGGFKQFVSKIGEGGVAAMELVARELKATGKYIARTLSFRGVTHEEVPYELNEDQIELYRQAAKAWRDITSALEGSLETTNSGSQSKSKFMTAFWSSHQRFFDLLLTALKTPGVIELAEQARREDKAVVITLVKTNEATQKRQEDKQKAGEEDEDEFDFGPLDILTTLIKDHWPVQQWADAVDSSGKPIKVRVYDAQGQPVTNPQAEAERDQLIADLKANLRLPSNPLDILIEHFGRKNVAELTGRSKYYDQATNTFVPRGGELARHDVNVVEAKRFQDGEKLIAVLSSAAGTGISLHAGKDVENQRKRVHITLQPGWSADKAMQMLGRTHRTNQEHPPEYKTLVSNLAGEKRFVATIAKRMASLGALTRGTTEGAGGAVSSAMEKVNFDSRQGRQAANRFVENLLRNIEIPGAVDEKGEPLTGRHVLSEMGLLVMTDTGPTVPDPSNVTRLLNRFLALDPVMQNAVFDYYYDIFAATVEQATQDGTLDTGVKELEGDRVTILESTPIYVDPETRAETYYYKVETENAHKLTSPEDLAKIQAEHNGEFFYNAQTGVLSFGIEARPIVSADGKVTPAIRAVTPTSVVWTRTPRPAGRTIMEFGAYLEHQKNEAERAVLVAEGVLRGAEGALKRHHDRTEQEARDRDNAITERNGMIRIRTPYRSETFASVARSFGASWDRISGTWSVRPVGPEHAKRIREAFDRSYPKPNPQVAEQLAASVDEAKQAVARNKEAFATATKRAEDPTAAAREMWEEKYEDAPKSFTDRYHMIGGAVLRWWDTLQGNEGIKLATDTSSGTRAVGVVVRDGEIDRVKASISGGRVTLTPSRVYVDVLENGTEYQLEGGVRIVRGRVARNPVMELKVPDRTTGRVLEGLGVTYEKGVVGMYYVPNRDGATILQRVLAQFPAVIGGAAGALRNIVNDTSGELRLDYFRTPLKALGRLKNPARAIGKAIHGSLLADALDLVAPMGSRVEREGSGGAELMGRVRRATDAGEVSAGKRLVRLVDAKLNKISREERWNLLDTLEGRADPMNKRVLDAYRVARSLSDEIADEAENLDVMIRKSNGERVPFTRREDYFPHALRGVEVLKSGPVRRDVLENMVRLGHARSAEEATEMLDQYVEFMADRGSKPTRVLNHMIATNQAKNMADALAKLLRHRTNRAQRNKNLEYAREIDLPFYDPDPARVLPSHVVGVSIRLAQVAELGQDNQVVNRLVKQIADSGGNAEWTRAAVDKILGIANKAHEKEDRLSGFLRSLQGFKLGLAAIPNATQTVNTLLETDLPSVAQGLKAVFTSEGRRFAIEAGAAIDPILHESVREMVSGSRALETYLKAVGFTAVERANRIIATNAGAVYASRMLAQLKRNPKDKRARAKLTELGIDVDAALRRGKLAGDDALMAGKKISDITQFRARPQDLPEFASTPWGKVFFQFKSFAYQQTGFMKRSIYDELKAGHLGRGFRNLLIVASVFPLAGEAVKSLRALITGRDREEQGLKRYLDNIAAVGALGLLWDVIEGAQRRKLLDTVAGPSAGMLADVGEIALSRPLDGEAWKRFAYRHAPLGSIGRRVSEGAK
jgi:2'-5' RNA ligase